MYSLRQVVLPGFLLAQTLLIHLATGREYLPPVPPLASFPDTISAWRRSADDPIPPEVMAQLNADAVLSRSYVHHDSGVTASLLVAWFQSQRSGVRQPHSPKVCLPGAGWTPASAREIQLETGAGAITANRMIASSRGAQVAVLYWYQTHRRTLAGEWAAKLWLIADAVRYHRSDGALVRIVVPVMQNDGDKAIASAIAFARDIYPPLSGVVTDSLR